MLTVLYLIVQHKSGSARFCAWDDCGLFWSMAVLDSGFWPWLAEFCRLLVTHLMASAVQCTVLAHFSCAHEEAGLHFMA